MAFSPKNLKIWVNSREIHAIIQTATEPPFTKGTEVFCHFYVSRTTPLPCTCNYCPLLPFCACKRVYSPSYYKFSSDAKRVIYTLKRVYLLVT